MHQSKKSPIRHRLRVGFERKKMQNSNFNKCKTVFFGLSIFACVFLGNEAVAQAHCPRSVKPLCAYGYRMSYLPYRYYVRGYTAPIICYRWRCRKGFYRCPTPRTIGCPKGTTLSRYDYTYRGMRCFRWTCRASRVCPLPGYPRCIYGIPHKLYYRYQGMNCWKWVCKKRYNCPTPKIFRCPPHHIHYKSYFRYKRLKCFNWLCRPRYGCPPMRSVTCGPRSRKYRQAYSYKGLTCWRWKCQLRRCPYPGRKYCPKGYTLYKNLYIYKGRACHKWRCVKKLR